MRGAAEGDGAIEGVAGGHGGFEGDSVLLCAGVSGGPRGVADPEAGKGGLAGVEAEDDAEVEAFAVEAAPADGERAGEKFVGGDAVGAADGAEVEVRAAGEFGARP